MKGNSLCSAGRQFLFGLLALACCVASIANGQAQTAERFYLKNAYHDPFTYTISPVLMRLDGLFEISESRPLE
jgi:hypothetical protein